MTEPSIADPAQPAPAAGPVVVAIDVGGTGIKASVWSTTMRELGRTSRPTPVDQGVPAIVEAIVAAYHDVVAGSGRADGPPAAVGLICPGLVDPERGIARYAANLGWRDLPLRDLVCEAIGRPVALDHDVRAAGAAELRTGAGAGSDDALYLQIGTGIASASVIGGRLLVGHRGASGEIGHLPARPDGERCACGQLGCTETYASASAIARRYRVRVGLTPGSVDAEYLDAESLDAAEVFARAGAGDPAASAVLREAVHALAIALVGYTVQLDPELIVVGGGLSRAGDRLLDPLRAEMTTRLTWRQPPELRIGQFGADAGHRGAALLAWDLATVGR